MIQAELWNEIYKYIVSLNTKYVWCPVRIGMMFCNSSEEGFKKVIKFRNIRTGNQRDIILTIDKDLIILNNPKAFFEVDRVKEYKSVQGVKLGLNAIARYLATL